MSLRIEDFDGFHEANDIATVESALAKRYNGETNSFWLSHDNKRHPALALLVRGNLAGIHYFPEDSHPGFIPSGNLAGLKSGEMTVFRMDQGGEEVQIANDAVVPFPFALTVAREFFASDALPKSVQWIEL